jgi:hypothetical protein
MSQPYEPYPTQPEQPPPATGPAQAYGAAQPYYAPNAGRPKDLRLTGWLAVGAAAAVTLSSIVDAVLVGSAIRDPAAVEATSLLYFANAMLYFLLLVGAYVATCLWLTQARHNSRLIDPEFHHARRSGWIWGGWVCPIVNFWFPFQIVRDVYRPAAREPGASPTMGLWWTGWVVFLVGSRIANRLADRAFDGATGNGAEAAAAVLSVITVVTLVLWAMVVRQVTTAQHRALGLG